MNIRALSRRYCEPCKDETLHNRALCTKCNTDNASPRFGQFQQKRMARLVAGGVDTKIAAAVINEHKRIHSDARRLDFQSRPLHGSQSRSSLFGTKGERTKA